MTTSDDRVFRSGCSNRSDQFCLYARPTITVFHHWFIYYLEEHEFRISPRQMRSESMPEFSKSLDVSLISIHSQLELVTRMNVNDYGQTCRQNHIERIIHVLKISRIETRSIPSFAQQWCGFDRKPHMIEPHRFNQRDVLRSGVSFQMRLRIVCCLREPVTEVYTAAQSCKA